MGGKKEKERVDPVHLGWCNQEVLGLPITGRHLFSPSFLLQEAVEVKQDTTYFISVYPAHYQDFNL